MAKKHSTGDFSYKEKLQQFCQQLLGPEWGNLRGLCAAYVVCWLLNNNIVPVGVVTAVGLLAVVTAVGLTAAPPSPPHEQNSQDQQDHQSHRRPADTDAGQNQQRDQGWGSCPHTRSRPGKPPKVKAYVVRNRGQVQYCVEIIGVAVLTCELPPVLRLSLNDWRIVVESAAANEQWRRTKDPEHLVAAIVAAINKKLEKLYESQFGQQHHHQQQQQQSGRQRQQQGQQQQRDQASPKPYVDAAKVMPDLSAMSDAKLRDFIREVGCPAPAAVRSCADRSSLLQLASRALQLWECKRLIRCSQLPSNSQQQKLAAALCALQFPAQPGTATAAARAVSITAVQRSYQQLARRVHPDKMHEYHREYLQQFEEACKMLVNSNEELKKHCS